MSNRVLYVGGFGNGQRSAEGVASELERHFEYVDDPITFSWAMDNPEAVRKAAKGAVVTTHSAGIMALLGTEPHSLHAFNAPLPTSRRALIARTITKTVRMHTGISSREDLSTALSYDRDAIAEIGSHLVGNMKHLGAIARFNAISFASDATRAGIRTELAYTDKDSYFRPTDADHALAEISNVPITMLRGQHDELVLRPEATLAAYLSR